MLIKLFTALFIFLIGHISLAQENKNASKKTKSNNADIPGSFIMELGLNFTREAVPTNFVTGFWGSRTFNIYYQYPIRLFKSRFSFNPGIGLSLERFKLTNNYTLASKPNTDGTYSLVAANTLLPGIIQRSQLINNYVDFPLEFRYDTSPEDISRSFNFSIGYRVGLLYDAFTKIDYTDNGEDKSLKEKQWHGVERFRYAVLARIGISGFSLFCYYNLTPLFATNQGPAKTQMKTFTIGISINGF